MRSFDLTLEEHEVLTELLANRLSELELELVHTDHKDFKEMLKRRQRLLTQVLEKLRPAPVAASA